MLEAIVGSHLDRADGNRHLSHTLSIGDASCEAENRGPVDGCDVGIGILDRGAVRPVDLDMHPPTRPELKHDPLVTRGHVGSHGKTQLGSPVNKP